MIIEVPYIKDCMGLFSLFRPSDYRDDRVINELIIHRQTKARGAAWDTAQMFVKWITDPKNKWGTRIPPYHFYIDLDGAIHQLLPLNIKGQHARGRNSRSIGIALGVDGRKTPPTEEMWISLQELCQFLLQQYPGADINGHSKLKRCPGKHVDIERLKKEVRE